MILSCNPLFLLTFSSVISPLMKTGKSNLRFSPSCCKISWFHGEFQKLNPCGDVGKSRQKTLGHRTSCSECKSLHGQFCGDCLYMRYLILVSPFLLPPPYTTLKSSQKYTMIHCSKKPFGGKLSQNHKKALTTEGKCQRRNLAPISAGIFICLKFSKNVFPKFHFLTS